MKIPIFPGKYHQNGGCSWAMLVSGRVHLQSMFIFQPVTVSLPEGISPVFFGMRKNVDRRPPMIQEGNELNHLQGGPKYIPLINGVKYVR